MEEKEERRSDRIDPFLSAITRASERRQTMNPPIDSWDSGALAQVYTSSPRS